MRRRLSLLTALSLLLAASTSTAAEWHPAQPSTGAPMATASEAASAYLGSHAAELDLGTVQLSHVRELAVSQHRTVRYLQHYHGLPVIGAAAAVRVRPNQRVELVVLDVDRELSVSPRPTVAAAQARVVAADLHGVMAEPQWSTTLAVLPGVTGGHLVWQIDLPTQRGGWRYLVDAHDGALRGARPMAIHALGRVYPISSVNTPITEDRELLDLLASTPQFLNGWNGNLTVTNYLSGSSEANNVVVEQTLEPSSGEDFLYDPPAVPTDPSDAFAQVGVYYHLTRMRDFFANDLAVDMSAASWQLTAVANMGDNGNPLDNAFFSPLGIGGPYASPNLIAIGQGSVVDFADDSDVFLHEFTHYTSGNAIGYNMGQAHANSYGLSPFGGAIDEGVSDYFACTENGDSLLGEASLAQVGAARELTDTSKSCPDAVLGEVHADGEIIGSFSWTLRELVGKAAADQLVWGALTLMTADATLGDYATAVQQTAQDLLTEGTLTATDIDAIDAAIVARGLDMCGNVLPLTKEQPRDFILFGLDLVAQFFGGSCQDVKDFGVELQSLFHYRVTPEPGDELLRLSVAMTASSGSIDWSLRVRTGEHVTFATAGFFPTVQDFDYAVEHITEDSGELVIDATSNPPFDPSADYYVVLTHQNCPDAFASLSTDADVPVGIGGQGGSGGGGQGGMGGNPVDPAHDDDGGCGCRTAGAPGASWSLAGLLAAAALALARRRRR